MHNCVCVPLLQRKKSYLHGFDGRALLPGFSTVEICMPPHSYTVFFTRSWDTRVIVYVLKDGGFVSIPRTASCLGWIAITLLSKRMRHNLMDAALSFSVTNSWVDSGEDSGVDFWLRERGSENLSRKSTKPCLLPDTFRDEISVFWGQSSIYQQSHRFHAI